MNVLHDYFRNNNDLKVWRLCGAGNSKIIGKEIDRFEKLIQLKKDGSFIKIFRKRYAKNNLMMKKERQINFERLKAYFDSIGFFESIYSENNFDFDFYKKNNDLNYLITLRYGLRNSSFYIGSAILVRIISEKVNNILEKFTYTKGVNEDVLLAFPNYNKNIDDESLNQLKNLPIQTQEEFEAALSIISTHIETYILPFFAKVPNLQTINDEIINKLTHDEYSNYIKGETNFKVLIIMKLCNNPNYDTFKQTLIEMYDYAIKVDEKKYKPDYDAFHNILNYLEGGQYQECLT